MPKGGYEERCFWVFFVALPVASKAGFVFVYVHDCSLVVTGVPVKIPDKI
jgi:hypothetical protein